VEFHGDAEFRGGGSGLAALCGDAPGLAAFHGGEPGLTAYQTSSTAAADPASRAAVTMGFFTHDLMAPRSPEFEQGLDSVGDLGGQADAEYATGECLDGVARLGLPKERISQLEEVSELLTGFRVPAGGRARAAAGLLRRARGRLLSLDAVHPAPHSVPFCTPEPDVVHEAVWRATARYASGGAGRAAGGDGGGDGVRVEGVLVHLRGPRATTVRSRK
jgi:hypothetical protein